MQPYCHPRKRRALLAKQIALVVVALSFTIIVSIIRSGQIGAAEVHKGVVLGDYDWLIMGTKISSQNATSPLQRGAKASRSMSTSTHSHQGGNQLLHLKIVDGIHPWLIKELDHGKPLPHSNCSLEKARVDDMCYPLSIQQACNAAKPGFGPEGHYGYQLLKKIRPYNNSATPKRNPRILCMIYTYRRNHHRIRTIAETWGKRCDGFLAFSDKTDPSIGALNLPHDGPESYGNMWQKTRSIVKFAHDHYLDDFDFFHLCGDDAYLVLENMRGYLASDELMMLGSPSNTTMPQSYNELKPLFLGAPMFMNKRFHTGPEGPDKHWFACAGGPGYTLNRAGLQLFDKNIFHSCLTNLTSPAEDVHMSFCLWLNGVKCAGWDVKEKARRYHGLDAEYQARRKEHPLGPMGSPRLAKIFQIHLEGFVEGASNQSFAFHLKREQTSTVLLMMQRYDAIIHNKCHD